jgi:hypothetical protein
MSRWTLSFGTTTEGKVVLMLEPLDQGKPETLTLSIDVAQSLSDNLDEAIHQALQQRTKV